MKKMKKVLSLGLAAIMTLGLTACGGDSNKTYNVGICQLVQHDALDAASKTHKATLPPALPLSIPLYPRMSI